MNFDKESKSEEKILFFFFVFGGGGGGGGGGPTGKKIGIRLFFVLMLYIKSQVPGSSGSLVLKVGAWSLEGIVILLIYFLNCRKALFTKK